MGIPGIWEVRSLNFFYYMYLTHCLNQILRKAMQSHSLTELAFSEGFDANRRGV